MAAAHQELRIDILTGREVILAAGRNQRPIRTQVLTSPTASTNEYDPFLEGNEHDTPAERLAFRKTGCAANTGDWRLRIVPNRYPAVAQSTAHGEFATYGIHEVVIECPDARHRLTDLSVEELACVFFAWQTRLRQIDNDDGIMATSIFRNEGSAAGASLPHCHSQILATEFVSRQLQQRMLTTLDFLRQSDGKHSSLFESWLASEIREENRIVSLTDALVTVCPYASRVDWHTRFVPNNAATDFRLLSKAHLVELALQVRNIALALLEFEGHVAQNLVLILPPQRTPGAFPWMLDFLPRKNRFAGFEMLTDTDILTLAPETAADRLRHSNSQPSAINADLALHPPGYEWTFGGQ